MTAYYKARPGLAVRADAVLKLNDEIGLHTSMTGFKSLWDQGKLAIVQGCGYPNPNRSHFTFDGVLAHRGAQCRRIAGWVERFADASWPRGEPNKVVNIAERQSLAVQAVRNAPVVFADPNRFVRAGDPSQEPVYKKRPRSPRRTIKQDSLFS